LNVYELDSGKQGPTRLFIGGVHGKEGRITGPILEEFANESNPSAGRTIIVPSLSKDKKHISTLNNLYYETDEGKKVLKFIRTYKPSIYAEIHCYRRKAYEILTDPERKKKKGIPPLIDLERDVLIGSVSPHLLKKVNFETPIIFEVPCRNSEKSNVILLELLKIVNKSNERNEIFLHLRMKYPEKIAKAIGLFYNWFDKDRIK
jgi:hypothetical protein